MDFRSHVGKQPGAAISLGPLIAPTNKDQDLQTMIQHLNPQTNVINRLIYDSGFATGSASRSAAFSKESQIAFILNQYIASRVFIL